MIKIKNVIYEILIPFLILGVFSYSKGNGTSVKKRPPDKPVAAGYYRNPVTVDQELATIGGGGMPTHQLFVGADSA